MTTEITPEKFKLNLSRDLIIYLFQILTKNIENDKKSEYMGQILASWEQRIDRTIIPLAKKKVTTLKDRGEWWGGTEEIDSEDVVDVLVSCHNTHMDMLREELLNSLMISLNMLIKEKEK
jgi:hypothetical protein